GASHRLTDDGGSAVGSPSGLVHMQDRRRSRRIGHGLTLLVALWLGACSDSVRPDPIASLRLASQSGLSLFVGETLTLVTEIRDSRGVLRRDLEVTWK